MHKKWLTEFWQTVGAEYRYHRTSFSYRALHWCCIWIPRWMAGVCRTSLAEAMARTSTYTQLYYAHRMQQHKGWQLTVAYSDARFFHTEVASFSSELSGCASIFINIAVASFTWSCAAGGNYTMPHNAITLTRIIISSSAVKNCPLCTVKRCELVIVTTQRALLTKCNYMRCALLGSCAVISNLYM